MEDGKADSLEFYPFAYSLYSENIHHYCWYCLDEERAHRKCSGCKTAVFCDKDCQQLAWKDHKYECRGIKATSNVPNIEVRLLGRIVVRYKAILCGKDKEDPNFYTNRTSRRSIMDIWAHTTSISQDQYAMKKFNAIYDELTIFYDSRALLARDIIFQLHCRDFINRHAISDRAYIKEIGKGLYLDLCAYDHSCRPNTIYVCEGTKAILRPLDSGVSLLDRSTTFYSYIDLLCGKQERRKLLKDTWYFHCECDRCKDNSEHILVSMNCPHCKIDPPQRLCLFGEHPYKDPETQLITCSTCHRQLSREEVMEALGAMRFIDDLLERSNFDQMGREESNRFLEDLLGRFGRLLPRINIYYCKIVQALIPLIDPENNRRLLNLHLEVEECIRICYPHNHPALGFHLRNIGIFSTKLEDYDKAVAYLTEALHIFKFVVRDEHSLTKSTQSFLEEAVRQRENKLATVEVKRHDGGELERPSKLLTTPGDGTVSSASSSRSSSQQRRVTVRCEVFSSGQRVDKEDAGVGVDCNAKQDGMKRTEAACNVETVVSLNIGAPFCLNLVNDLGEHQQNVEPCTLSTEVEEVELEVVNRRRGLAEECVEGNLVDSSVEDNRRSAGHQTFRKDVRKEQSGGKPKSKKTGIKMPKSDSGSLPRKVNAEPPKVPSAIEDGSCRRPKHHNDVGEKRSSGPRSPKKLEIPVIDGTQEDISIVVPNSINPQSSTSLSLASHHHHAHKHHIHHHHHHHHHHHERNKDADAKSDEVVGTYENLTPLLLVGGQAEDPNEPLFVDIASGVKKKAAHKKVSPRSRTPIPPALFASATTADCTDSRAMDEHENVDDDYAFPSSSSALTVPMLTVPVGGITSDILEANPPALSTSKSAQGENSIPFSKCDYGSTDVVQPSSPTHHFDIVSTTTFINN